MKKVHFQAYLFLVICQNENKKKKRKSNNIKQKNLSPLPHIKFLTPLTIRMAPSFPQAWDSSSIALKKLCFTSQSSHPTNPLPFKLGSLTSGVLSLIMLMHPQLEIQVLHRWAMSRKQSWRGDPLLCTAAASTSQQGRFWNILTCSGNKWTKTCTPSLKDTVGAGGVWSCWCYRLSCRTVWVFVLHY